LIKHYRRESPDEGVLVASALIQATTISLKPHQTDLSMLLESHADYK